MLDHRDRWMVRSRNKFHQDWPCAIKIDFNNCMCGSLLYSDILDDGQSRDNNGNRKLRWPSWWTDQFKYRLFETTFHRAQKEIVTINIYGSSFMTGLHVVRWIMDVTHDSVIRKRYISLPDPREVPIRSFFPWRSKVVKNHDQYSVANHTPKIKCTH